MLPTSDGLPRSRIHECMAIPTFMDKRELEATIVLGVDAALRDSYHVFIPDRTTMIHADSFSDCNGLISVTIPGILIARLSLAHLSDHPWGITTIPDSAFIGCSGLASVTIPEN
eukprot:m.82277 g.82277  ORF g.82277 m.82277 type:complete len:114 (-) comp11078_c0_seq2:181-522(-)